MTTRTSDDRVSNLPGAETQPSPAMEIRQLPGLLHGRDDTHATIEALVDPFCIVLSLGITALLFDPPGHSDYLVLALILVTLTFPGRSRLHVTLPRLLIDLVALSTTLIVLLLFFGWATQHLTVFPRRAILHWFWIAPACLVTAHLAFRACAPLVLRKTQRCVIVGMNDQGLALATRIVHNPYTSLSLVGFFDDRESTRAKAGSIRYPMLGRFDEVAAYAMRHHVQVIYLSVPMATQDRTIKLLGSLRDTTASIYFVPDHFVTELIQSRMSSVVDIPVIAVCETPFVGINGWLKRASDVVLAAAALVVLSPVFLLTTILVWRSSPGPAIFRQRRYGLDGEEIIVYKFRSMRVVEDGVAIRQAQRNDARTTPIGAFLRKTSLDELPQLVNVLQGRMSMVGPRPHAVAHNELYRKMISGYMIRHKVRPGITGWAQVNGLRGETATVEKMEDRIRHDIDYLRNWSLRLDLHILLKTALLVVYDRHAF